MEPNNTETKTTENTKHNMCAHGNDGHCCGCAGCEAGWWKSHRGYFIRRWISLFVGVLLAFWVGMKLGELKALTMASYGDAPNYRGGMMRGYDRY